jgi:hypothetical protein
MINGDFGHKKSWALVLLLFFSIEFLANYSNASEG